MRRSRHNATWRLAAAVLAIAVAAPAIAGQPGPGLDLSGTLPGLPPAADSGKPAFPPPGAAVVPGETERCPPALPCGARLLGTVRRNGAVELQVPALRW